MIIKPGKIFFIVGLILLESSSYFVNVDFLSMHLKLIKLAALFILLFSGILINLKNSKLSYNKFLLIIFLILISIISYFNTKSTMFLELLLVLFNVIGIEFDKLIKYDLGIKIYIVFFLISCNLLGYADSEFIVTRAGLSIRNAYGFYHPNTFGMVILMIFLEFIFLNRKKINFKYYILAIIMIFIIRITSDTRTAIYCIALYMILLLFKNSKIWNNKFVVLLKNNLFIILAAVSLFTTFMYMSNSTFSIYLNKMLSNRLTLQAYYLSMYNITFFGNNIDFVKTLDNGFMKMILYQGFFVIIFLSIIYNLNFKKCERNKMEELSIIFIIILIFSVSESTMFYIYNNIFVCYFLTKNEREDINEAQSINCNTSI